jgi:hypothetical protein
MDGATDKSTVWFFLAFLVGSSQVLQPPLYIRPHLSSPATSFFVFLLKLFFPTSLHTQPVANQSSINEHLGERPVMRSARVPIPPDGGGAAQLLPPQEGRLPGDRPRRHTRSRPQQARAMGHPR